MKHLRLVALVFCAAAWTTTIAFAGDSCTKGASAAGSKATCSSHATTATAAVSNACPSTANCPMGAANCTPEMRAKCTAEMQAQCAKGAKGTKATAAAMSAEHCAKGTSASAATAKGSSCCATGASAAAASTTPAKGAAACCASGASSAAAARCDMKGTGAHGDCSVCTDEATCDNDLRAAGVRSQVVGLRNGAMVVYTADSPEGVRAMQATVARYNEHIMGAFTSGSASLCGGCKAFRGAMASGKFTRELVNVKNGCQVLLTSSDKSLVRRIHDMTGAQVAARVRD